MKTKSPVPDKSAGALSSLSDEALLIKINSLNIRERRTMLAVLLHLGEVDRRRLYLGLGYSSLFDFCVRRLKYSESAAGRRVRTARCIREYPRIAGMLLSGELNLSTLSKISGIITKENSESLLENVRGRSYREVEAIVSRFDPRTAIRDRVKPVYVKTVLVEPEGDENSQESEPGKEQSSSSGIEGESERTSGSEHGTGREFTADVGGKKVASLFGRGRVHEVLEERYKLEFSVDAGFMEKLERVKSLMSAKIPEGLGFEKLFGALMDEYIDRHSPESRRARRAMRKMKKVDSAGGGMDQGCGSAGSDCIAGECDPHRKAGTDRTRRIPRAVRDEVYARDGGRCTFTGPGGRRCDSGWNLEIDHIVPVARGGGNEASNLRLLCARHNLHEAERVYGGDMIGRRVRLE